jgi:hypothetical protein
MKCETAVTELFLQIPHLEQVYRAKLSYMLDEPPLAYVVFGDALIPELERALRENDAQLLQAASSFLENMALSSKSDFALENLMKVEIGEWLGYCANENVLALWLGQQTRRVCNYVPGLATQRRSGEQAISANRV